MVHHMILAVSYIHRVPKKGSHFYFLNSSVRHWPILIIFGMQHQEETWHKWLILSTSP